MNTTYKVLVAVLFAMGLSAQDAPPVRVNRWDTVRIIQKAADKSSGNVASLAKAFTSNNGAGNTIIVACGVGNGTAPTISDTRSNTYTSAVQVANGSAFNVAIFSTTPTTAGANTVTCNNGGSATSIAIQIYEIAGTVRFSSEISSQTNSGTGTGTALSTGAIAPIAPGEYAFAVFGVGTAAQTITVGASFTNDSGQQNPTTPSGLFSFAAASRFLGDLDSVTATATITSEPWAAAIVSFRPVIVPVGGAVTDAVMQAQVPAAGLAGKNTPLATDLYRTLYAGQFPLNITTYAASKQGLAPAATPTDIAVLSGNATNTVIVTWVSMSCTATTAGIIDILLLMRTTADSGGTSTTITGRPLDTNNAAAVSSVLAYTANPTINDGTVRNIDAHKIGVMAAGTATPNDIYIWRPAMGQSVTLRGTAQQLAINLNSVTLTGGSCDINYQWIETTGL